MDGSEQIRSAFERGEVIPPGEDAGGSHDGPGAPYEVSREAEGATFPLNDYGNGQRLLLYYGEDMLFVPRLGWYRWQGDRWLADEDQLTVRRDAQKIAGKILEEVTHLALEPWEADAMELGRETAPQLRELDRKKPADLTDEDRKRRVELREIADRASEIRERFDKRKSSHRRHSVSSGNTSKISNMLEEAKPVVACPIGDLNADPLAVNCSNGTIKFVFDIDPHDAAWEEAEPKWQVRLCKHNRADLISKIIPVPYDENAVCPTWRAFLDRVQPDTEVQDFLQRWVGYCLTGKTSEQKLLFNYGAGRNGKSTFVDTLAAIFADYGTTVPIETLTGTEQRKGSDATPDLVRLPGARFVRASEPEQGTRMKEAMIKALTGGEAIMIRRMMQEFVEVTPEFKLMISGNHKPEIRGSDDGIWRRVMLLNWGEQISEEEVDPTLPDKLKAEAAGILAWAVRGYIAWADGGLRIPAVVREATDEYRQESDKLRLFLQTECEITGLGTDWEPSRDLRDAFNGWLLSIGEAAWGSRAFARALRDRAGVVKGETGAVFMPVKRSDSGYSGIRIKPATRDLIAKYGDELRSVAARKG
ncbi:DNA primase family protein [Salipiger thiooxidans]|uniref:DNA primase family protein n=1 Tax=Salipiger thiooxidans TaxID=282683 RepID=UPI001CD38D7A|nr:DNA primase family protein [Salipiger thiooxidans]MCA0851223.1 phage/plasmid primase, P4 family [Salipiger thiooxidans]